MPAHRRAAVAAACLALSVAFTPASLLQAQSHPVLKVMDWNIHHGLDTGGANNLDRVAAWIAKINADVVSLNEVEKLNGYNDNADEPAQLQAMLQSRTGRSWYTCFAQRDGEPRGQGNLVLSRMPIVACDRYLLTASRSVARATLSVNGITVNVFSTHLDDGSASTRGTQVQQLMRWARQSPAHRILMGDFNASATASELQPLKADYQDAWAAAAAGGSAVGYAGNTAGNTRNGRIDYIWRSDTATLLSLQSAQVYDTGSISDHRPVSATYGFTTAPGPAPASTLQPPRNMRVVGH